MLKKTGIAISYLEVTTATGSPSCMYHLPHLYNKQDCLERINKEEIEEFDSVGELPSNFTLKFSDFVRTVVPNNRIKTPKNSPEALKLFLLEKIDQYS